MYPDVDDKLYSLPTNERSNVAEARIHTQVSRVFIFFNNYYCAASFTLEIFL